MKKISLFLSLIIVCLSCSENSELLLVPEEETPEVVTGDPLKIELKSIEKEWASSGNSFAMNLFALACDESEKENVLLSPLSLQLALGMLSNGANEAGLNEIATAMGFKSYAQDDVNSYFSKLASSLTEGDPSVALNLANSAWIRNDFVVKDAFVNALKESYLAQVNRVDFSKPVEVKKLINDWCSEQTNGKINEIDLSTSEFTRLVLANACYLKGSWTLPFESVEKGVFTTEKGQKQNIDMMKLDKRLNFYENAKLQAVDLPYGNESFSMVVILPDEGVSVEEAAATIEWDRIRFGGKSVEVALPKFKLKSHTELESILQRMGIKEVFNTMPNIADGLFVSQVFQDMFIETNETGTEAAAVTVIEVSTSPGPGANGKMQMTMDRPFLFAIRENSTGVILFMGKVGSINE